MITLPGKLGKIFSLHAKPIQTQLMLGRWSILETPSYIYKYMDTDTACSSNTHTSKTYTLEDERLAEINKRRYNTKK